MYTWPQYVSSDIVPIQSWTWTLRPETLTLKVAESARGCMSIWPRVEKVSNYIIYV